MNMMARHTSKRRRTGGSCSATAVAVAMLFGAQAAQAQELLTGDLRDGILNALPDWEYNFTNTAKFEYYRNTGNRAGGRYPNEGGQLFDEFDVNFSREYSPYQRAFGHFTGVLNDSDYRSPHSGVVLENANFTWIDGESEIPHRVEIGDYFGYFSFRTLQRPLKGGQLDLQPLASLRGETHSLIALVGSEEPDYQDFTAGNNLYAGGSWMIEHRRWGRFAFNAVRNQRESDLATGTRGRGQTVYSLAGENDFQIRGEKLLIEGEIAYFKGDYGTGANVTIDQSDGGYFLQLKRRPQGEPLSYSLRYEYYGNDYQPNGGSVTANRRSLEGRVGWRFQNGINLGARVLDFTDGVEKATSLDTLTSGLTVTGPLLPGVPQLNGRVDAFVQTRENRPRTVDQTTHSLTMNFGLPLSQGWTMQTGGLLTSVENNTNGSDVTTRQMDFGFSRALRVEKFVGSIRPGLLFRNITGGSSSSDDYGVRVQTQLAHNAHQISASYNLLFQQQHFSGGDDLETHDLAGNYSYTIGPHQFGLEADVQRRHPDLGNESTSYRFGAFWRFALNRPARIRTPSTAAATDQVTAETAFYGLTGIAPNLRLDLAGQALNRDGFPAATRGPNYLVYETSVLPGVDQRQRLVLTHKDNRIDRMGVVVDLGFVGNGDSVSQVFERIREDLIRRYGSPIRNFQLGEFSANLVNDVNEERFIRVVEWSSPQGTVRLGLPRRLDKQVRIEVQLADGFPPPSRTQWSLEQVP